MHSQRRPWLPAVSAWFALLCFVPCFTSARAQETPTATEGPLASAPDVSRAHLIDNEVIVRMAKSGLGDDVLIQTIKTQPGHYDTTPDDLILLKTAGISDKVILVMQAYGTPQPKAGPGLHVRGAPPPIRPALSVDASPLAPGIDEIGVYYKAESGEWVSLKSERVEFKSGGWIKSTLTHNIVGKDMNGHLEGPKSTLGLRGGVQILIYAPEGTQADEYDLVRFREHSDSREFRVMTGGVFHSHTGSDRDDIEFDPKKIAPQMYVFTMPEDIQAGQYGLLPPGSSNVQGLTGTGKIFTFAIGR